MTAGMVLSIGWRKVGGDVPTFVVAEMSGNHNQSFKWALQIVEAAACAGSCTQDSNLYIGYHDVGF